MDEILMTTAGKPEVVDQMQIITKDLFGTKWDRETCGYAFEIVIEAMKRSILQQGRLAINNFCTYEMKWQEEHKIYDSYKNNGEYRTIPPHNILSTDLTPAYRKQIKLYDVKFIKGKYSTRSKAFNERVDKSKKEE